jgi:drug/metabolite transporter (DMT)-like permease
LLSVHGSVLLFGLAGLFGKWIMLPAPWIVLGRTAFATVFLLGMMRWRNESYRVPLRRDRWLLRLSGALLALHWVAFFASIQLSTVAIGLLTFSTFPLFTTLLEPLFGQGRLTGSSLLLALITLLGIALVVPPLDLSLAYTQGAIWGLVAGLSFAFLTLINGPLTHRHPARRMALWQDGTAALLLLPVLWLQPQTPTALDLGLLLLLGVLFTGVSHTLFIAGLRVLPARLASLITTLEPVYGIIAAALLLGERPTLSTLLGGALILAATGWASWQAR